MARIMRQGQKYQKNFTLRQFGTWKAAEKATVKPNRKACRKSRQTTESMESRAAAMTGPDPV